MKTGLAIWHYPHRSVTENVRYFAEQGLQSVSVLGYHLIEVCRDPEEATRLAEAVKETGVELTVHHKLPRRHSGQVAESTEWFYDSIDLFAAWQKKYGVISILSFDVSDGIRDNITPYLDYVLENVPNARVAVEDFGLNERERKQLEYLKGEPRFGYLLDMGHMIIRMGGKDEKKYTLFTTSELEGGLVGIPKREDFLFAYRSKEFPIFEIHLHNNDGAQDLHSFLEDGVVDMAEIAAALKEFGYDGIITVESVPGDRYADCRPESDRRIMKTIAYWEDLCRQIGK